MSALYVLLGLVVYGLVGIVVVALLSRYQNMTIGFFAALLLWPILVLMIAVALPFYVAVVLYERISGGKIA